MVLITLSFTRLALRPPQKHIPLDLRAKKTRAIRRRMTKEQVEKVTEKAKKKANYFPLRKFAVKSE